MYGNYSIPIELSVKYTHEPIQLDIELSKNYQFFAKLAEDRARRSPAPYFNGPCARLIDLAVTTSQLFTGGEQHSVKLHLGPVSWEQYNVLNTFLDYRLGSGLTVRELYAKYEGLYESPFDLRWCSLSNLLVLAMTPMTTDGYALVQERNPQGVSTDQGMFTCGVAENIHRWLDEAPANELVRRINPLITLAETQNKVDFNYTLRSAHVPSPLLAAQRGIWEEVSEELWRLTKDHKDLFKFLNIVFDLNAFVPVLIGVIELPFSRQEVEKIRVRSPGKDHSEYKKIHYVPLNQGEEETRNLLLSFNRTIKNAWLGNHVRAQGQALKSFFKVRPGARVLSVRR